MWHEYRGNIHLHTTHSDGTGTFDEVIEAAQAAGLDFIYATDHNVLVRGQEEGYRRGVLTLVGQEVHDVHRVPQRNHLLCLGVRQDVSHLAPSPQSLIDGVGRQDGLSFLAHPVEEYTALMPQHYSWEDWGVSGYTGVEIWNYMCGFRGFITSRLRALLVALFPHRFTVGPVAAMLRKWDELTQSRAVVAIGGTDAHAWRFRMGPLERCFLPYLHCLRALNTHILVERPFLGADRELDASAEPVQHDHRLLLSALQAGHCWVGYDLVASSRGFRFQAWQLPDGELPPVNGAAHAIMGDTLEAPILGQSTCFRVRTPRPAEIRLLRNGRIVARQMGRELFHRDPAPGVYRVEVWLERWGKPRGWIFSNPIYVRR